MQQRIIDEARRFNVACLGRRSGKTTLGVRLLLHSAIEGKPVAWFSPTYKMLVDVWRYIRRHITNVMRVSESEKRIDFLNGGIIEMWSLEHADAIRGRKYQRVIIDEAAMVKDLDYVWAGVIRPTLADLKGDAFFLSTPKGRNYFWECYQKGQRGGEWASWQMPTDCNPFIDSVEIQAMRDTLPALIARQEIDAEPVVDGGGVFRNVRECVTNGMQKAPIEGHSYVAGMDIGRTNDYSVVTVIDTTTNQVAYIDRYTDVGFSLQEERVRAVYNLFAPDVFIVEINNFGHPFIESLVSNGIPVRPFRTTNQTKAHIIEKLAIAFEHQRIGIPEDEHLIEELLSYEVFTMPSGLLRYGAPSGKHDDMVMALAFAWYAAEG